MLNHTLYFVVGKHYTEFFLYKCLLFKNENYFQPLNNCSILSQCIIIALLRFQPKMRVDNVHMAVWCMKAQFGLVANLHGYVVAAAVNPFNICELSATIAVQLNQLISQCRTKIPKEIPAYLHALFPQNGCCLLICLS